MKFKLLKRDYGEVELDPVYALLKQRKVILETELGILKGILEVMEDMNYTEKRQREEEVRQVAAEKLADMVKQGLNKDFSNVKVRPNVPIRTKRVVTIKPNGAKKKKA
jgi:hypothetical protein